MAIDVNEVRKQTTKVFCPLFEGREKADFDGLEGDFVVRCCTLYDDTDDTHDPYAVVHLDEFPESFFMGGSLLTNIVAAVIANCDDEDRIIYGDGSGVICTSPFVIRVGGKKKSKQGGRSYYVVEFVGVPDDVQQD